MYTSNVLAVCPRIRQHQRTCRNPQKHERKQRESLENSRTIWKISNIKTTALLDCTIRRWLVQRLAEWVTRLKWRSASRWRLAWGTTKSWASRWSSVAKSIGSSLLKGSVWCASACVCRRRRSICRIALHTPISRIHFGCRCKNVSDIRRFCKLQGYTTEKQASKLLWLKSLGRVGSLRNFSNAQAGGSEGEGPRQYWRIAGVSRQAKSYNDIYKY